MLTYEEYTGQHQLYANPNTLYLWAQASKAVLSLSPIHGAPTTQKLQERTLNLYKAYSEASKHDFVLSLHILDFRCTGTNQDSSDPVLLADPGAVTLESPIGPSLLPNSEARKSQVGNEQKCSECGKEVVNLLAYKSKRHTPRKCPQD